ncbi:MAG: hypothetical protein AB7S69_16220 [Salinivirgaceae bacterium]
MKRRIISEKELAYYDFKEAKDTVFKSEVRIESKQVELISFSNCILDKLTIIGGTIIPIILNNCECKEMYISGSVGVININKLKKSNKIEFETIRTDNLKIRDSEISRLAFSYNGNGGYIKEGEISDCIISKELIANVEMFSLSIQGINNIESLDIGNKVKHSSIFVGGDVLSTIRGVSLDIGEDCSVFMSMQDIDNFVCNIKFESSKLEVHDSFINTIHLKPHNTSKYGLVQVDNCFIASGFFIYEGVFKRIYLSHLNLSNTHIEFRNHIESEDFSWDNITWPTELYHYGNVNGYHDGRKTIRSLKQKAKNIEDKFSILLFNSLELKHKFESIRPFNWSAKLRGADDDFFDSPSFKTKTLKFLVWLINPLFDFILVFFKKHKGFPIQDRLSLYLSKYSNDFGLDWFRASLLTLIGGGFIFYFYGLGLSPGPFVFGWNDWNEYWSLFKEFFPYYIKFLNPTHDFEMIVTNNVNSIASLWDFIGRIYISFGYYQIIKAFRKFF